MSSYGAGPMVDILAMSPSRAVLTLGTILHSSLGDSSTDLGMSETA